MDDTKTELKSNERRDALRKMGKLAAYTAPAMMVMLASKKGNAGGWSDREFGNNGFGNGGYDGVPGRSGFQDDDR